MKALANEIYNNLLDMDCADYNETQAEDLENLAEDLELLENKGNGTLLNVLQVLVKNH